MFGAKHDQYTPFEVKLMERPTFINIYKLIDI